MSGKSGMTAWVATLFSPLPVKNTGKFLNVGEGTTTVRKKI